MGLFKILSVLAVIALAATVNADLDLDCQANCFGECTKFVNEVAAGLDDCQVSDSNQITNDKCHDHCELVCFDGPPEDCANECASGCGAWAKDLAADLECTADAVGEAMENEACINHCSNVCA